MARERVPVDMDRSQPGGRGASPNTGLTSKMEFQKDGSFGPRIHMYNDSPGVYVDAHGVEVPAVVAKRAGFDIELNMALQAVVNEQKRLEQRRMAIAKPKAAAVVEQVRPLGHTLVRVGDDAYHIEDKDGQRVTSSEQPRVYAIMWLDDIDPMGEDEEEASAEPLSLNLGKSEVASV